MSKAENEVTLINDEDTAWEEMPEFNYGGNPCGADGHCPYRYVGGNGKTVYPCMEMCGVEPISE